MIERQEGKTRLGSVNVIDALAKPRSQIDSSLRNKSPSEILSSYASPHVRIVEDIYGFYTKPERPSTPSEPSEVEPFSMGETGEFEPPYGDAEQQQISFGGEPQTGEAAEEEPEPRPIQDIVKRYTLTNTKGTTVQIISYGATVVSIKLLDKDGVEDDVVLGFDDIDGYVSEENQYFGGTLGRVSGIIENAVYAAGKRDIYLSNNLGYHHFHGGFDGFDKVLWESYIDKGKVIMTYISSDREEGYPGNVLVQMAFSLTCDNRFIVEITAKPSKPTPISITPHIYFNMAGHGTSLEGMKEHCIMVNADRFVMTDLETGLPTGKIEDVGGSYYDLRVPRPFDKILDRVPGGGYDHTFCLSKGATKGGLTFAVRLVHPPSGRFLEVTTDNPGLHIYTANRLPNPDRPVVPVDSALLGKNLFLVADLDEYDREYKVDKVKQWPEDGGWPRPPSEPSEEHIFRTFSQIKGEWGEVEGEAGEWGEGGEGGECQWLPGEGSEDSWEPQKEIKGKMGCTYRNHGGICLMPQDYPNAINIKKFPRPIAYPGKGYQRTIVYYFGVVHQRPHNLSAILDKIQGET